MFGKIYDCWIIGCWPKFGFSLTTHHDENNGVEEQVVEMRVT